MSGLQAVADLLAHPSVEHVVSTHDIASEADARWEAVRRRRVALAERIADAAVFEGSVNPSDLDNYRELHFQQVAARRTRSLAIDELVRSIEAANGGSHD